MQVHIEMSHLQYEYKYIKANDQTLASHGSTTDDWKVLYDFGSVGTIYTFEYNA